MNAFAALNVLSLVLDNTSKLLTQLSLPPYPLQYSNKLVVDPVYFTRHFAH